jgi:hypothetical protein
MIQVLTSEAKSIFGNPWRPDQWNITTQGKFIARYGKAKADEFAKLAGSMVGATKPTIPSELTRVVHDNRTFIINKRIGSTSGADGQGSSGEGSPV